MSFYVYIDGILKGEMTRNFFRFVQQESGAYILKLCLIYEYIFVYSIAIKISKAKNDSRLMLSLRLWSLEYFKL